MIFFLQDIEDIKQIVNIHKGNTFVKIIFSLEFLNPTKSHFVQIRFMPFHTQMECPEPAFATTIKSGVNTRLQFGVYFICPVYGFSIGFHVFLETCELYTSG